MSQSRRVRFSLAGSFGLSWADFLEAAKIADELGFYGFYPSDHFMMLADGSASGRGYVGDQQHDSLTMIAALTGHTTRLRLGTLVLGNLFRNPGLVAKMISAIDHASNGRVELGIGANWQEQECRAYGFDFPPPRERLRRLRESLIIIRALWRGEPATFAGEYYSIDNPTFEPKPLQSPHPPIIVGGGSRQALRMAVDMADEWNSTAPYTQLKEKLDLLDELCAAAGRSRDTIACSKLISLNLTESKAEAQAAAERIAGSGTGGDSVLAKATEVALIGGAEEVAEQISRWSNLGVDHFHFSTPRPMNRRMLETFAAKVMPRSFSG